MNESSDIKPGYQTTEFWTTAATGLIAALNSKLKLGLDSNALLMLGGLAASYVLSRGWVKKAAAVAPLIAILFTGCAWQHTASIHKSDGSLAETYTGVVWFNRTALKGLEAHKKTANGSSAALSLKEGSTETQPEALKAGSESLGILLGTAMKYAK